MEEEKKTLNLDEALGTKALKVRFQGKDYQIRTVNSLSPAEFGRVMAYGEKFSTITDEQIQLNGGETILKAIDDFLEILGPDLPRYKPTFKERFKAIFNKKAYKRRFALSVQEAMSVMEFWAANNRKNGVRAAAPKLKKIRK